MIVEFITVSVTFRNYLLPVDLPRQTARGEFALLATQTHGTADL